MTTSKRIFTAVTDRTALGPLGPPLSKGDGESIMIAPLVDEPSLLFKQLRPNACTAQDGDRLDRLIALPRRLAAEDRRQLSQASCWPVSRVVENGQTVGVLLPRAPNKFNFALQSITGVGKSKPLAIDWLAKDCRQQAQRGLPYVRFDQRIKVCRDIAAVAAILEQEGVVYGDWSYANALWSIQDFSGYLIDVDSCAFGARPWVNTPNWEDPLTPQGTWVDMYTDRYRLAMMVARCLSGKRDVAVALNSVRAESHTAGRPAVELVLSSSIHARSRQSRPTVAAILRALGEQPAGNVVGWKPVGSRPRKPQPVPAAPLPRIVIPPPPPSFGAPPPTAPSSPVPRPVRPVLRPRQPKLPSIPRVVAGLVMAAIVLLFLALHFFT